MKARLGIAVVLVGLVAIACSSSSSDPSPPTPAGTTAPGATASAPGGVTPTPASTAEPAPAPATQTVGTAGGSISAGGIAMSIPAGALATDTTISITPNNAALPSGYTGLSPLYTFAPDGTVFQKPVTVAFTLASPGSNPTVYWSNASGGYDELATTATATGVSATIAHFSHGFVAEKKHDATLDGGDDASAADSGAADSGAADSGAADSGAADSGAADSGAADAGTTGITATVDGVLTTFSANASVVLGTSTTTITASDSATSTHWTLQIVMTGIMQEACQLNGNPFMTYTHYTSGSIDALYSSKSSPGTCLIYLASDPTNAGDHATGTFSATVGRANAPTTDPASHGFQGATFDIPYYLAP